jgi:hypothetical protein
VSYLMLLFIGTHDDDVICIYNIIHAVFRALTTSKHKQQCHCMHGIVHCCSFICCTYLRCLCVCLVTLLYYCRCTATSPNANMLLLLCHHTLVPNSTMQRVCLRAGMWQQAIALLKEVRASVLHTVYRIHSCNRVFARCRTVHVVQYASLAP